MNGGSEEKKSLLLENAASSADWKVKLFHILFPEYPKNKMLYFTRIVAFLVVICLPIQTQAVDKQPAETILQQLVQVDKELNKTFKQALNLLNEKDKQSLRKEQNAWIKERDKKCGSGFKSNDMETWFQNVASKEECGLCVLVENRERLESIKNKSLKFEQSAISSHQPPYPDIWDWVGPGVKKSKNGNLILQTSRNINHVNMTKLPDGDVLLRYKNTINDKEAVSITFFSRKTFTAGETKQIIAKTIMRERKTVPEKKLGIISSENKEWEIEDIGTQNNRLCYFGPNFDPVKLTNVKSNKSIIFTIFMLLNKPEYFFVEGRYGQPGTKEEYKEFPTAACQSRARQHVKYKVVSVGGEIMFLDDGTFLFPISVVLQPFVTMPRFAFLSRLLRTADGEAFF